MSSLLSRFKPPTPLAGRLSVQSFLFAMGDGAFMAGSAVFFTVIVGLTPTQVGIGLTIAGIASFAGAVPAGKIVDRFGPKRMWAVSSAMQASLFCLWPFIDSFGKYVAMAIAMEIAGTLGGAAHGAYTIDVLPTNERVKSRAYMYSALNAGFTVGSGIGLVALAIDSDDVLRMVPWLTAAVFAYNAFNIMRLPDATHDVKRTKEERAVKIEPSPLKNPGWMTGSFFLGVLWTNQVVLSVVIPLWVVSATDAPREILALLFATNTIMCILLPMRAARGVKDLPTALRALRISAVFFIASCIVTMLTHETIGWMTIAVMFGAHIILTGAELFLSAASWSLEAELMDPRQRGAYSGASEIGGTLGRVWAPALYTFLALTWGAQGWLVIAAIIVAATIGLHFSARAGQRFLERHDLDPHT